MKVSGSQIRSHLEDRMSDGDSLLSGKAVVEIEQVSPPEGKFIFEIDFEIPSDHSCGRRLGLCSAGLGQRQCLFYCLFLCCVYQITVC